MAQNQLNQAAGRNQIAMANRQMGTQGLYGFGQGLLQYGLQDGE